MTDNEPRTPAEIRQDIANAQAGRVPVDSQGRPTGPPTKYVYANGRLVSATPAEPDEDD